MARDTFMRDSAIAAQRDQTFAPMEAKMIAELDPVGDFMRGYGQMQQFRLQERQASLQEMAARQQMLMQNEGLAMQQAKLGMEQQELQQQALERRARLATEKLRRKEIMSRIAMSHAEHDLRQKTVQTQMMELEYRKQRDAMEDTRRKEETQLKYKAEYAGKVFPDGKGGHVMFVPDPGNPSKPLRQVQVPEDSPLLRKTQARESGRENDPLDDKRDLGLIKELEDRIDFSRTPEERQFFEEKRREIIDRMGSRGDGSGRAAPDAEKRQSSKIPEPPDWAKDLAPGVYKEARKMGWTDEKILSRIEEIKNVNAPKKEKAAPEAPESYWEMIDQLVDGIPPGRQTGVGLKGETQQLTQELRESYNKAYYEDQGNKGAGK